MAVPYFPQTLPANTLVGRLGSNGPTEAIPIASLFGDFGTTEMYATRAAFQATTVAPLVTFVYLAGYAAVGDGGNAYFKRVVAEPVHAGKVQSADGAWFELVPGECVKPEQFGAFPASADCSALMLAATVAAVALGTWLELPERTYRAAFIPPTNSKIRGQHNFRSKIVRPLASVLNYVLFANGASGYVWENFMVDGDRTNNLNACNVVVLNGGNYNIRSVHCYRGKDDGAGGYGGGFIVTDTTDTPTGTRSYFEDVRGIDCDSDGVLGNKIKSFAFVRPRGRRCKYGFHLQNSAAPTQVNTVTDGYVKDALGTGCSIGNVVIEGRLLGANGDIDIVSYTTADLTIDGATGIDGAGAGVCIQGDGIVASNIQAHRNADTGALLNMRYSSVTNVRAKDNGAFGVDAGYFSEGVISGIVVTGTNGIGLNGGGGKAAFFKHAFLGDNDINAFFEKYEASPPYGSPVEGDDLHIEDFIIDCLGGKQGLVVAGGLRGRGKNIRVKNVSTYPQAFNIQSHQFPLTGCSCGPLDFSDSTGLAAAATSMIIPPTQDTIIVTGSGVGISLMLTQNQVDFEGRVAFVDVTNPGAGYTSNPTLNFSAAASGAGAAGTLLYTPSGLAACPRMTNFGNGAYGETTFAVSATGGGGAGFAATAYVGLRAHADGRRIILQFQGVNVLVHGTGNINCPAGENYTTKAGEAVELIGIGGTWVVIGPQQNGSGTYTPTLTNGANVASSTAAICRFSYIGRVVHVSGTVTIDPTAAAGTLTVLGMTLPIASNLAAATELSGVCAAVNGTVVHAGIVQGNAANNRAEINFSSQGTPALVFNFNFTYTII